MAIISTQAKCLKEHVGLVCLIQLDTIKCLHHCKI